MKQEIKILIPNGMLGYGVPLADFERGIAAGPDAIIVDSGSTDPGPYLLGMGKLLVSREAYVRDLTPILDAGARHKIPVLIGSAGGPGTNATVDEMVGIVDDIAKAQGHILKIAVIYADIDRAVIRQRLEQGRIRPCGSAHALQRADIDSAINVVAQMGAEPFYKVLTQYPDIDVVIAGRAYDPAPFAGLCMLHGIDPGLYWHMGKIAECGANCAEPKGKVLLATIRKDSFDLEPMSQDEKCSIASVAAHTLYEKSRPDLLAGPGGVLDLGRARYEQVTERTVRVTGSRFLPSEQYSVKLEGASQLGYRTIFIGGVRDPILVAQIDSFLERVKANAFETYPELRQGKAFLHFHVYGKNGVMGAQEPVKESGSHEIGLMGEVTAPTQELANAICSSVRIDVLHTPYPGQVATAGNFAIPLNPPENPIGPVYRFSVYHLMEVDTPEELFPIHCTTVGATK
ncbi:acyclic terpene utilization AtuA family protein [Bordetella sp. 15P40C-2]|uniref:acyclic terpene utilization AtuA family protein n=1 Tax=Bordetella sp. 15P40C-2 TaxID=2572246 RepID=UPI00132340F8|nr:acyclic terpene utilization AtuA family protein [Bordetella sp. 15P40C-2]MVW73021.1 acyclic terpene utilization AtuA family protein [Bordetella sp. 15P40C-2]